MPYQQHDLDEKRERKADQNQELLHRSRLARVSNLSVGVRVTVKCCSRNRGDARVTMLYTGKSKDHVAIEYDDNTKSPVVDPLALQFFDEEKHSSNLREQLRIACQEAAITNERKRTKFIEVKADQQELFLWRGLRLGESSHRDFGLHAKSPLSNVDAESAVLNGSLASKFIHCTKSPLFAIYYAAAFDPVSSHSNSPCHLAQIDISKLHPESLLDVSSGTNFISPQARDLASSHQIVLIREHIPARAVVIHDLHKLRVPRGVKGTTGEYVDRLLQLQRVLTTVNSWKLEMLQKMLQTEIEENCRMLGENDAYPPHVVGIARFISKLQQGPSSTSRYRPLWRKVLGQGKPID
jgi:hypothetical protein